MVAVLTTTPLGRKLQFDITEQTIIGIVPNVNIRAAPTTLYALDIDNTVTSNSLNYLKLYDDKGAGLAAAVSGGSARADIVIPVKVPGGTHEAGRALVVMGNGLPFVNGLSWAASKDGGNTAGSAPDQNLKVQALTQETT